MTRLFKDPKGQQVTIALAGRWVVRKESGGVEMEYADGSGELDRAACHVTPGT